MIPQCVLAAALLAAAGGNQKGAPLGKDLDSAVMLSGDWVPDDPREIDFDKLPRVRSEHAVISDVRDAGGTRVNQHNYLVHHDGLFWAMWSDGPGAPRAPAEEHRNVLPGHDLAGQRVSFATSRDGKSWSEIRDLAGPPDSGFGWIARGFWIRDGKLLALVSRYKAPGYPGPGLQLHAFEGRSGNPPEWKHLGIAYDDALNNFAPKRLPNGQWMMSRRDHRRDVHLLFGGTKAFNQWESVPFVGYGETEMAAEEPYWWILPDGKLVALFRDNLGSGFLFRAFSTDQGRTWSRPVRTNFPDATSKFNGLRLSDGRYVLVSNSNPKERDPLTIALSDDGIVFTRMGYLVGGRHVDYPHVIEHDGHLYVAFAGAKQTVEVLKICIDELAMLPAEQDDVAGDAALLDSRKDRPPAEVIEYLNLDQAEASRQQAFARSGVQEIAPVLLPDGEVAAEAGGDAFTWPHGGIVDDVLIVHFRVRGGLIRSTDGGRTWEDPVFTDCGILVLGTTGNGKAVAVSVDRRKSNRLDVLVSKDKGESWQHHRVEGPTPAHLTGRIVAHPRFGLIAGGHPESNQLVFLVSQDEGQSWRRVAFPLPGFYTDGTVPFAWGDNLGVFARRHHGRGHWSAFAQCYPTNIEAAQRFEELQWQWTPNNIFVAKMDTPDAVYNPVSGRLEAVTTKRDAGFPYRDSGLNSRSAGYMTLNLWSIAPDEFLNGKKDWRFEGVLLRSKGEKARLQDPRDGMHPAGTVIDQKRGVQHIFIYGGDRAHGEGAPETGRTGVFRITRTLDTARWREKAAELDNYDQIFRIEEDFESLDRWVTSGSPMGQLEFHRTEPPRRVGDAPLPQGGMIAIDGQRLCIQTGEPGYHGLHCEDIVVTPNYRFEFKARVRAYADRGDMLGVNVNCGPQKFHLILRKDGVYDLEAPERARQILKMPMGDDWSVWAVEMRDGQARVYRDGEFVGNSTPMLDPVVGSRPISIYSNPDRGPGNRTDVQIEYFRFENL